MVTELNKQIALKLGYSVYHYDKGYPADCYYMLMTPDFNPVVLGRDGERKTEDAAWGDCPNWQENIGLAMELVGNRDFEALKVGERWTAHFVEQEAVESDEGLAEAIVKAFMRLDLEYEKRRAHIQGLSKQITALRIQWEAESAELADYESKRNNHERKEQANA